MRVDIEQTAGAATAARHVRPPRPRSPERPRIDRFELGVLAAFSAVSLWVLALDLWHVIAGGWSWTGTDGVFIVDQLQYLAWIRDASHHLLVSNLFVLGHTPADYFQPAVAISGGLTALGVPPAVSLLLWKPVAVAAIFFVVRLYVHRSVEGIWARRAALVLALFFGSFTVVYGKWTVLGDLFPGFLSWGYVFALLGLALMAGMVLIYDRAWTQGRISLWPGLLGAIASLLHPWNGELAIAVLLGTELLIRLGSRQRPAAPVGTDGGVMPRLESLRQRTLSVGSRRRVGASSRSFSPENRASRVEQRLSSYVAYLRPAPGFALPLVTAVATGLPLLYYAVLGRTDLSWELARGASKHSYPLWSIFLAVAPLLVPAVLGYRKRPQTFLAAATRVWPLAAVVIYVVSASAVGATPLHAFQGITIPLAILAVQGAQVAGWRRLPHGRLLAIVAVLVLTVPTTFDELKVARNLAAPTAGNANFVTHDEARALDYLASSRAPGGVLTEPYLGSAVPGITGRRTYVGDCLWSEPNCYGRTLLTQNLFGGSMPAQAARSFVLGTSARFVLADCQASANLPKLLGPIVESSRRFGCAAVYTVK